MNESGLYTFTPPHSRDQLKIEGMKSFLLFFFVTVGAKAPRKSARIVGAFAPTVTMLQWELQWEQIKT